MVRVTLRKVPGNPRGFYRRVCREERKRDLGMDVEDITARHFFAVANL